MPGPRYERGTPNELWHIDLKGPFYLQRAAAGRSAPATSSRSSTTTAGSCWASGRCPTKEAVAILDVAGRGDRAVRRPAGADDRQRHARSWPSCARCSAASSARLAELSIRHIRTQIDTPWTNGKVEAFWATSRPRSSTASTSPTSPPPRPPSSPTPATTTTTGSTAQLGWQTPAERFDGTPFTDRGFEHVPALAGVADLLADLLATPPEVSHFHRGTSLSRR